MTSYEVVTDWCEQHLDMACAAAQVTHFEFSNESNKAAYNGMATAAQYAAALLDWGPRLKAIKPDLLLGANGVGARSGHSEAPGDSNVCWWQHVRPASVTAKLQLRLDSAVLGARSGYADARRQLPTRAGGSLRVFSSLFARTC